MADSVSVGADGQRRARVENEVPTRDEHSRYCLHYVSFGSRPCDCDGPDAR